MYRLNIKIGNKWNHSLHNYDSLEKAKKRKKEILRYGIPKKNIKIIKEDLIFN